MDKKIVARLVIEVLGSPEEHVKDTMIKIIDLIKEEKGVKLLRETTYATEKVESLWSTFSDIEIEVVDIEMLSNMAFKYMPSSVEILEPFTLSMESSSLSSVFNDVMAKIHDYDMIVKKLNAELLLRNRKRSSAK